MITALNIQWCTYIFLLCKVLVVITVLTNWRKRWKLWNSSESYLFILIKMNHPVVVGNWFSINMDNCDGFLNWMEQITGDFLPDVTWQEFVSCLNDVWSLQDYKLEWWPLWWYQYLCSHLYWFTSLLTKYLRKFIQVDLW